MSLRDLTEEEASDLNDMRRKAIRRKRHPIRCHDRTCGDENCPDCYPEQPETEEEE